MSKLLIVLSKGDYFSQMGEYLLYVSSVDQSI